MFDVFHGSDFEGFVDYTEGLSTEECENDSGGYGSYTGGFSTPRANRQKPEEAKKSSPAWELFKAVCWGIIIYSVLESLFE